jgi:hypothetical protein
MRRAVVALAATLAIAAALWQLDAARAGLVIARERIGPIPVTVFRPTAGPSAPAVIVAHGFAGSQQLMQPFAVTLARNGYVALTFDLPGHARNPSPLPGGLADRDARTASLLESVDAVVRFARTLPEVDGRVALLGHSMASDVVVRYAEAHADVEATVAVSLFLSRGVTASSPRNLLIIDGALEPGALLSEGYGIVAMAAGGTAREGTTYGAFADGTARRFALAAGVEHIGVLYSRQSMAEALDWMNQAFGRRGEGFLDARGPWLGLLYLGLVALAWPLAAALPRIAPVPLGAGLNWRELTPIAVAPALLTPLILWSVPGGFLPLLVGDYLLLHFGLYGLITAAGLWHLRGAPRRAASGTALKIAVAAVAVAAYGVLAIGLPTDRFATSFIPWGDRLPLVLVMLAGTLPYFVSDEWLTRGAGAPRGAYAATKLLFLLSLAAAIALNLAKLFFLVIIVPAILAFFVVYGLFSAWAYRRTNHPLPAALANALAFAWAIAVAFPIVSR